MPRTTRLAGLTFGLALIAGALLPAAEAPAPEGRGPTEAIRRLQLRNQSLVRELELATGKSFYLLLDPGASQLVLAHRGTELHRWTLLDARLGVPRVAFIEGREQRDWAGVIWSDGRLDPQRPTDRVEIKVAGENEPEPPLPPEVAIPVPANYTLRYQPGLVLEIGRSGGAAGGWRAFADGWRARGRELIAVLSPGERRMVRIRAVLSPADADSLYRSLPPDTRLLIVAPAAGDDPRTAAVSTTAPSRTRSTGFTTGSRCPGPARRGCETVTPPARTSWTSRSCRTRNPVGCGPSSNT